MSDVSQFANPLSGLEWLLGLGTGQSSQSSNAQKSGTSSSGSTWTSTSATSAQRKMSTGMPASSRSGGFGGEPLNEQVTPMTVTLAAPMTLDMADPVTSSTASKTTNHVVSVPTESAQSTPLTQSNQGWMVFGAAWYWWVILVSAVVVSAVLVNKAFETKKRGGQSFKQILRL